MRTILLPRGNHTAGYVQEIEFTLQCPTCLAIETIFLEDGTLTDTKHWKQFRGKIYHRDCGRPARLINLTGRKMSIPSNTSILLVRMLEQEHETIGKFAVRMGVSRITVKRWLQGKCYPNCISRRKLARYTKTPAAL